MRLTSNGCYHERPDPHKQTRGHHRETETHEKTDKSPKGELSRLSD